MVASGLLRHSTVDQALDWLRATGAQRLVVDSRQVRHGDAFVAWPGAAHDARQFVHDALVAGACACIVAEEGAEPFGFDDERVAALARLKQQLSLLCAAFYGHPSAAMDVMAVTGTNGKTSTAWWWSQASALLGERCAVVGTLGIGEPATTVHPSGAAAVTPTAWTATGLTTPDPATLQGSLAGLVGQGVRRCAIEASSIGLAEHRLDALRIRVALFTNFSQDHLDYHHTLENYWAAKRQLFDWPTLKAAVIHVDQAHGARLHAELKAQRPALDLWSVGESAAARLRASRIQSTALGTSLEIQEAGSQAHVLEVPFLGAYNVHNLLGVVAGLRALGYSLEELLAVLPRLSPVPGRLQAQGGAGEPLALVDYAHTPDALDKALSAIQGVARARGGQLWVLFGCGGDRDRSKRPAMGKVAKARADRVVLTTDNPRTEDPQGILDDIAAGISANNSAGNAVRSIADRRSAIFQTLQEAGTRDVVLVAGKGHEDYQEVGGARHPFSDVQCVAEGLKARTARGFMTLADVAACLGKDVRLLGDPNLVVHRVHTDTRSLQAGDLYVALRGERFDGHDFLAQAREAGAVAALAEGGLQEAGLPGIQVADSLKGLQGLARAWRAQLDLPVIAVTGSNGKTTVTQMTASILQAWKGERAAFTRGNLNNHIGVPLSVLSLRAGEAIGHEAAVLELGMNHPGEVQLLAAIAQPTVAVVNNAQREHQEFMHTVQAVAEENGAVLQALPPNGTAVFPSDDEFAAVWDGMAGAARVWRFSFEVGATTSTGSVVGEPVGAANRSTAPEVVGRATWRESHWSLAIDSPAGSVQTTLHMPGRHNVHNALAAATAALAAGAPLWAVAQGLAEFQAVTGRSRLMHLERPGHPLTLIDDTYNANPDSVRAAIEVLAELPGPRALILGDMGEVGEQGPAFHAEVGGYARQRGLEHCWTLGTLCAHTAAAYGEGARHFESMDQLTAALADLTSVRSLLIKGSRFMRMERVVSAVQSQTMEAS